MTDPKPKRIKVDKSKQVLLTKSYISESCEFQLDGTKLTGKDDKMQLVGTLGGDTNSAEQWCVGLVGEDGEVTLYPAQMVTLQQRVVGYTEQEEVLGSTAEQYRAMVEDFGTAKKRKMFKSREANRVAMSADGKTNLSLSELLKGPPPAESEATALWRKSFLPKWNPDAKYPKDVYDPVEISGDAVWSILEKLAERGFEAKYMVPAIEVLLQKDGISSRQKCCLILAHYFADFYQRFNRRSIPPITYDKRSFYGTPFTIAESFLEKFSSESTGNKRSMSQANKDSCLVHVFVLYILGCEPKKMESSTVRDLALDMRLESQHIAQLLRQAGFKVTANRDKGTLSAKLNVPLQFPVVAKRASKK